MSKRIFISINNLGVAGAERYVVQLANNINECGHEVAILAGNPLESLASLNKSCAFKFFSTHPGGSNKFAFIKYMLSLPIKVMQLIWFMYKNKFDAIYTFLPASGLPAWIAGNLLQIPVYYFPMHGFDVSSKFESLLHKTKLPNALITKFVAGSDYLAKELIDEWSVSSPDKIIACGMGINTQLFLPAPKASKTFTIGCVSRLHIDKQVDLLINAYGVLRNNYGISDIQLIIAGEGDELQNLQQQAKDLGVFEQITFLGLVSESQKVLPMFDLYMQTSKNPNIGLSAIEALSCGVPLVIAYRNDKEKEMAEDTLKNYDAGWVIQATPQSLAESVLKIKNNPEDLLLKKAQARLLAVDKYDLRKNLETFIAETTA